MMGSEEGVGDGGGGGGEQQGLIPRICKALFQQIDERYKEEEAAAVAAAATTTTTSTTTTTKPPSQWEYTVDISYMEVYNESVYDLLTPEAGRRALRVREHPKKGAYVDGLVQVTVEDYEEVEALLDYGGCARTVATTTMNNHSSRSHSIFTLVFRQFSSPPPHTMGGQSSLKEKVSYMHLVDLAGSERVNNTGASGMRLKEATCINKSLSTLGDVVNSLSSCGGHSSSGSSSSTTATYIPYRNSVLTWLLKDSLGGNAKTCMLVTISPSDVHYEETLSSLKYAERAKKVSNYVVVNEATTTSYGTSTSSGGSFGRGSSGGGMDLRAEVASLRQQLQELSSSSKEWGRSGDGIQVSVQGVVVISGK